MTLHNCVYKAIFFGIGGTLLLVGVMIGSVWPILFKSLLKSQLALTKNSKTFDMWVQTPMPMYIDIYLFNWTNSHDVTAKPILQEVGPFVFREERTKKNIVWNQNKTVTYQQSRQWVFHQELSNGTLSDKVTNLNVIAVTIGNLIKAANINIVEKKIIDLALNSRENLIVTKTVNEWLFEGYEDPILDILEILKNNSIKVPVQFDKFGWFYQRNNSVTADGVFTMETGVKNIKTLGNAVTWNGRSMQPFYSGACRKVEGSFGELWSPFIAENDEINLYATDVCGSLKLTASGILTLYDLSGRTYVGNEKVFDNGTIYPDNGCYCVKDNCPLSGVRDVSVCRGGAPVYLSFPHFYLADSSYRKAVEGLNPEVHKHSFSLTLEEKTGVPMQVKARLQINLLTEPIKGLSFFKVPRTYMPMIWFNQHTETTPEIAHQLKPLSWLAEYGVWAFIGLALFGLILLLTGVFLKMNNFWGTSVNTPQRESLLEN